ncbi:hypothetical protein Y5W_00626 [Alcanivorax sp. 521-1]|uniref:DUF4397 domain-containing protein n=1 Tax=Alloalcanivorax profundimaris TaxID=2735259 RepID=A0ABS0AMG8_9GAMM|nr:hypothetical protein [Alloalcanivorax profundimaris]MBF5055332.1 hypothetical protein [Alloalcanivorax profundimaris]
MNLLYFTPLVVAAAVASSCGDDDDDGFGGSLRSDASVFYYNQITSNGDADQSTLTADVTLSGDDSDSVSGVGYSGEDEGPELRVRIDDANDNDDNSVSLEGVNSSGGRLFRTRVNLANNSNYTAVSYGDTSFNSTDIALFQQDASDVDSGVRFRVINTVDPEDLDASGFALRYSDAGTGNYFSTGVRQGDATEYQSTNAGSLNLVVARTGVDPEERFARVDCSLSGSRTYDVILAANDPLNPPLSESEAEDELVIYCHPQERN